MDLPIIIAVLLGLVVVAAGLEAYFKRNRHRNISENRPENPDTEAKPLGMEATDLDLVRKIDRKNRQFDATNASLVSRFTHRRK